MKENRLLQPEQLTLKPRYTCNNCKDTGWAPCMCFCLEGAHACNKCTAGLERYKELGDKWEGPHDW